MRDNRQPVYPDEGLRSAGLCKMQCYSPQLTLQFLYKILKIIFEILNEFTG